MDDEPKARLIGPTEFAFCGFAISLLLVALGYWVAAINNEAMWAARFGCIGVVYGLAVLVGFRWCFGQLRFGNAVWEQSVKAAVAASSSSSSDNAARNFAAELNKYGEYERSKWVFLSEVSIIGVGTLQWGFGDWVALNIMGIGAN